LTGGGGCSKPSTMKPSIRVPGILAAGLAATLLVAPAAVALDLESAVPQCGGDKGSKDKKDDEALTGSSVVDAECGGDKGGKDKKDDEA
jgi:hypothetical protein